MTIKQYTVGVLSLQGAFKEHIDLFKLATESQHEKFHFLEVKTPQQLLRCDALVIPGGESTSMSLIAERTKMIQPLVDFIHSGKPLWGTCAGLIFLSREIVNGRPNQKALGAIDIQVKRNAFGRQLNSFESMLDFSGFIEAVDQFPAIFIRAPVISKVLPTEYNEEYITMKLVDDQSPIIRSENESVNKSKVELLYTLDNGLVVAARQGNVLVTSFHPELSDDCRFHRWFIQEFVAST